MESSGGPHARANCADVTQRIVAWMVLALLSVGALLGWMQYETSVERQAEDAERQARAICVALQESCAAPGSPSARGGRLQSIVSSSMALGHIADITVLDPDGWIIADGIQGRIGGRGLSSASGRLARAIHRVAQTGKTKFLEAGPENNKLNYLIAPAISAAGEKPARRGVIVIAMDLATMHRAAMTGTCQAVVLVSAQILVMWLIVATLLRRWVLNPLRALAAATKRCVQSGRFVVPPNLPANEVGELGLAFEKVCETLAESQDQARKLALIAARTGSAVVLTDARGRVEWVNDAFTKMTEYTLDEVRGQVLGQVLHGPQTDAHAVSRMRVALAKGQGFEVELVNYTRSRKPYWVHIEAQPIRDDDGRLTNFMSIESDVTLRKRSERELKSYAMRLESTNQTLQKYIGAAEAATQAKSEFLANMSHEIRTPMTAILGYADLLLDEEGPDAGTPRAESLRTIRRNGEHLLELINGILDLSKIEAGRLEVERIACHPVELARDVVQLMQVRAEAKGLALSLRFEGHVPRTIQSDPTRLRQILINLLGNAIKFTAEGSVRLVVRNVRGSAGGNRLQFDVHDTGIGMSAEQVTRLFEPFSQADTSTTRRFGGTGLGLSISKRLAEMLRGEITVESSPGAGSMFRLEIEAVAPTEPEPAAALDELALIARGSQKSLLSGVRVLLAEDSADSQRLLMHVLRTAGAEVALAENGQVALDKALAAAAAGRRYDIILMDMQMPVLDGYDATARLRQEGYPGPIVALTAHAMSSDRERCLAAGCDDYASKPIDRQRLVALIAKYRRGRPGEKPALAQTINEVTADAVAASATNGAPA